MKVLIIYEEVPEDTKVYVEEVSYEDWEWMKLTHKRYVNASDQASEVDDACLRLSEWLVGKKDQLADSESALNVKGLAIEHVLHTGFLL